mgnify:CR=1 FL=1
MTEPHSKTSRPFLHVYFSLRKYFPLLVILLLVSLTFFYGQKGLNILNSLKVRPADLLGFFGKSTATLSSQNGVTNFLILGLRGEGVDSPDLTDSIILISLNQKTQQVSQIGVPRDLWVPSLQAKINTAYHYGEEASAGSGIKLAEASILETLGQPINYTLVINFNLFKQTIDLVGGIDLNISPGFQDKEYPLPDMERALPVSSRYETITFPEGKNHLDGEMALKFVRSRHSVGDEGTDFARSARQQQVISALKNTLFTKEFLLNKTKLEKLFKLAQDNLSTNIPSSLYPVLARIGLDQDGKSFKNISLSTSPDSNGLSILYNPPVSKFKGEWVLLPKDNNWNALKQYLQNQLTPL